MSVRTLEQYLKALTNLAGRHSLEAHAITACASQVKQQYEADVQAYGDSQDIPPPAPGFNPLAIAFPLPYQEGTALRAETERTSSPPSLVRTAQAVFNAAGQAGTLTPDMVRCALQELHSSL